MKSHSLSARRRGLPPLRSGWLLRLMTFALAVLLGAGPAFAVENATTTAPTAPVTVSLASLSPGTLTSGADLVATVVVQNTGHTNLSGGKAQLALGSGALDSLSTQQRWETSSADITSSASVTSDVPTLTPGASTQVTLTLPSSKINISYSMTSLPIEVKVTGTQSGGSVIQRLHTTTPWTGTGATFTKIGTQIVVPLTLPADPTLFTTTGTARFNAWNKAIGPGSPIDQLLAANPSIPVTWLIDPAVLDPPTAQDSTLPTTVEPSVSTPSTPTSSSSTTSSGGSSASSSGSATSSSTTSGSTTTSPSTSSTSNDSASSPASTPPTTVAQLAQRLRDILANRPSTQQVWFTPYGDPDLSTLTGAHRPAGSDGLLRRVLSRGLPAGLSSLSTTVVAAPVAPLDAPSLQRLTDAWAATRGGTPPVLTPSATLQGASDASVNSVVRRTSTGVPLLGVDASLSQTLADTTWSDAAAAAAARSRTLAIFQQQPSTTRSVLAVAPRETITAGRLTAIASALDSLAWTTPESVDVSKAASAPVVRLQTVAPGTSGVWPRPSTAALTAGEIKRVTTSLNELHRFAGITQNDADIVPAWSRSLDQPSGTRWRGHPDLTKQLVTRTQETVEAIPSHVSVLPSGTINFFTDTGAITVTVRNDLARAVKPVTLRLHPRSYIVRFTSQPAAVALDAGSRSGVRVDTAALAAGSVNVLASLQSANGVELGSGAANPVTFTINARPTGTWIYWVLGIVAMLIFCYGLARNHKKGTRRRDELARNVKL